MSENILLETPTIGFMGRYTVELIDAKTGRVERRLAEKVGSYDDLT